MDAFSSNEVNLIHESSVLAVPNGGDHDLAPSYLLLLMKLASDAIIVRDPQSRILSWNGGAEALYGWPAREVLGQVTHELLQTVFPLPREMLDQLLIAGQQWAGELTHTCKDGRCVIVESRQVITWNAQREPVAILEINRDITERKQSEQEDKDIVRRRQIEKMHTQLAALVESADIPMISKTREGIITSWNSAAERMYGYSAQEMVNQSITRIFPADRQDEFTRIMEQIIQGQRVDLYETVRCKKDGTFLPVAVTISPIRDRDGIIIGASDIAHDISEHKRQETQERFLMEVWKILSSTLDYQETLSNIARIVVPQLADWFAVDVVRDDGTFELLEIKHKDPGQMEWARRLRQAYPIDPTAPTGFPRIVRTGLAELYPQISDEMLVAGARSEEELALARQIGYSSAMFVPLIARGKTVGVVSFITAESGRKYDERDLDLAKEIGRRAGVALDNARLYRDAQQARDQLEIILQGVADGIIVYAPDSRIIYANEAARNMTEHTSVQDLLESPPLGLTNEYKLVDEKGQPFSHEQLTHRRVLEGEREAQAIIGYTRSESDAPERWSLVKSRPVLAENAEVVMVVTIIQDITERMLAERRKDEFISMASHELKTPVTSLKGFTNVLQRRLAVREDPQGLHYLARMDAQLNKLTALISDLLDISRMQAGKLIFRVESLDLDALVAETIENVQAATSTHQLLLEGATCASVSGDKERLGQVFMNLLTNAIKYSPQAQRVVISLARDEDQKQVIVRVRDFGIGIEKSHHQYIFERFYQVTDPEEKTYPGLGIGLYISHEIVTRHRGRIWVESTKGEGATFFVALPLLGSDEAASLQGEER